MAAGTEPAARRDSSCRHLSRFPQLTMQITLLDSSPTPSDRPGIKRTFFKNILKTSQLVVFAVVLALRVQAAVSLELRPIMNTQQNQEKGTTSEPTASVELSVTTSTTPSEGGTATAPAATRSERQNMGMNGHARAAKEIALPCRLLPWSGMRAEASRTFYALSNTSIWVHQPESGGWTELRSTLVSPFGAGWSVRCELASEQVIAVGNSSHVLVYHRALAKWWNLSGTELEARADDAKLVWCHRGAVHVYSPARNRLLRHDTRSLKVIASRTNSFPANYSLGSETRLHSWFLPAEAQLYALIERPRNGSSMCNCSILMQSSVGRTELDWSVIDEWSYSEQSQITKPSASNEALTWVEGTHALWLWSGATRVQNKFSNDSPNGLWQFDLDTRTWRRRLLETQHSNFNNNVYTPRNITASNSNANSTHIASQQSLSGTDNLLGSSTGSVGVPLMGWTEGGKVCTLLSPAQCREPFGLVKPVCLQVGASSASGRRPAVKSGAKGPKMRPSKRPPRVQLLSTMKPQPKHHLHHQQSNGESTTSSSTSPILGSSSAEDAIAETTEGLTGTATTEDVADEEVDGEELDLELGSPWHDSESGVFDSIVFCATSAVALCLVSALWCVRHCAPFPKEALLPLRDPPSVRYTAIPDHTLA